MRVERAPSSASQRHVGEIVVAEHLPRQFAELVAVVAPLQPQLGRGVLHFGDDVSDDPDQVINLAPTLVDWKDSVQLNRKLKTIMNGLKTVIHKQSCAETTSQALLFS